MARWFVERSLWLTLAALAVLLVLLGILQYRWVSQIGRAERDRRQAQLQRSTWRFANGLDRELGRAAMAFRLEPAKGGAARAASVAARFDLWQQDDHAALLRSIRFASADAGQVSLFNCTSEGCRPEQWPAALEPIRARLERLEHAPGQPFPFRAALLVEEPPTLVVPVLEPPEDGGGREGRPRFRVNGVVLLELDVAYLAGQLLPQITESSVGNAQDADFAVTLVRRRDRSVLYTSDPDAPPAEAARVDAEVPAPFGIRPGGSERSDGSRRERSEGRRAERLRAARDEDSPWLLLVRHRGGTLEQAVRSVWRHNLAVGLGVLALLGAAGVVLATGAQRARGLARQQLEFVAGVTHELNTPLAAIRSAGQNLADGIVTDPQQVRRYGGLIEKEGSRLTSLVAQVLDFAGIESGSRAYASDRVSLAQVVEAVLADMRLVLQQSGLTVKRELQPDLPEVVGDAAALRRVVANLLANTAKFAAAGGHATVRVTCGGSGRTVLLRVEDRGPGIPAAERERVFEPFYRGSAAQRNETPGSGLGLSFVRRVVLAHGGRVRVEEPAAGGAAVVVELPAAPKEGGP